MFRSFVFACTTALALSALAETSALENTERDGYLNRLKQQHATTSERTALLAQVNSLLNQHALLRGYQIGQPQPQDVLFSVQVPDKGVLHIREERQDEGGRLQVRNRSLQVYGLNPFFDYQCKNRQPDCVILHESQQEPLLRIVRRPDAAAELGKALSYLVRDIQRD